MHQSDTNVLWRPDPICFTASFSAKQVEELSNLLFEEELAYPARREAPARLAGPGPARADARRVCGGRDGACAVRGRMGLARRCRRVWRTTITAFNHPIGQKSYVLFWLFIFCACDKSTYKDENYCVQSFVLLSKTNTFFGKQRFCVVKRNGLGHQPDPPGSTASGVSDCRTGPPYHTRRGSE